MKFTVSFELFKLNKKARKLLGTIDERQDAKCLGKTLVVSRGVKKGLLGSPYLGESDHFSR